MSYKKVSLYSLAGLRNEADEHLHESMEALGFKESFRVTDTRLLLGYGSVVLAGLLYLAEREYHNDFTNPEYVSRTTALVLGYFLLQGALFLYDHLIVEKCKYVGYKQGKQVAVSTWTVEGDAEPAGKNTPAKPAGAPLYCIEFDYDGYEKTIEVEVGALFYEDGFLNQEALNATLRELAGATDKSL